MKMVTMVEELHWELGLERRGIRVLEGVAMKIKRKPRNKSDNIAKSKARFLNVCVVVWFDCGQGGNSTLLGDLFISEVWFSNFEMDNWVLGHPGLYKQVESFEDFLNFFPFIKLTFRSCVRIFISKRCYIAKSLTIIANHRVVYSTKLLWSCIGYLYNKN